MIQPGSGGLYHPKNEDEIIELIQFARQNKVQIRLEDVLTVKTSTC